MTLVTPNKDLNSLQLLRVFLINPNMKVSCEVSAFNFANLGSHDKLSFESPSSELLSLNVAHIGQ